MYKKLTARQLKLIFNLWPPFRGAGIKVVKIADDYSFIKVSLAFRWYNKNYMRTQYGGNLFSMTDPFYVIMLIQRLGPGYVVWDKQGEIDYKRPGKGRVYADFHLTEERLEQIINDIEANGKTYPVFETSIYDDSKQIIATVKRTLYVRKLNK